MEQLIVQLDKMTQSIQERSVDIKFEWDVIPRDVTLVENGKDLQAHKHLLMACSPYFKDMFSGKFRESSTSIVPVSLPAQQLQVILAFIYKTNPPPTISYKNIVELYTDADFLQMVEFRARLLTLLKHNITKEKVLPLLQKALHFQQEILVGILVERIKGYWHDIWNFKEVHYVTPKILVQILSSGNKVLSMTNQTILESLLHYLNICKIQDKQIIEGLFSSISFCKIPSEALKKVLELYPNLNIPFSKIVEMENYIEDNKICTVCQKSSDKKPFCRTVYVHTSEDMESSDVTWCKKYKKVNCKCSSDYNHVSRKMVVYSCCDSIAPCKEINVPHTYK